MEDAAPRLMMLVTACLASRDNGMTCIMIVNLHATCDFKSPCQCSYCPQVAKNRTFLNFPFRCEKDVDECASDPCMNGGFCVNYVNSFECVCDMNYSGIHCQIDVSDFYLYLFLGLWQNLFQLVSYLVIRLDDEPEIEWGFQIND